MKVLIFLAVASFTFLGSLESLYVEHPSKNKQEMNSQDKNSTEAPALVEWNSSNWVKEVHCKDEGENRTCSKDYESLNETLNKQAMRNRRDYESLNTSLNKQAMRNRRDYESLNETLNKQAIRNRRDYESLNESLNKQAMRNRRDYESLNETLNKQAMRNRRDVKQNDKDDYPEFIFDGDASSSCAVPNRLKTAYIRCKIMPQSKKCKSYCIYGYTYDEGIERTHSCKYSENTWSLEFDECAPFVDCRLKLVSPGTLKCVENKLTEGPKCEVSCERFEDKDQLKKDLYSCKSSGTWIPFQPFCVAPKGGRILAQAPKITEHSNIRYP